MGFLDSVRKAVDSQQDSMARKYREFERTGERMSHSSDPETAAKGRAMKEKAQQGLDSYDNILAARADRKERNE